MLETVKIRRAGFPVRRTFKDFFSRFVSLNCCGSGCLPLFFSLSWLHFCGRYKIILKEKVAAAGDDKKRSTDLLFKYDKTKKEWQLGKTKVGFSFRQHLSATLAMSDNRSSQVSFTQWALYTWHGTCSS